MALLMIVSLYAMIALGIALAVLFYTMCKRINLRLPANEQVPWNKRTSEQAICSLYDRCYPNTRLTTVFRTARIGILVCGLVIIILMSISRKI